MKVMGRLSSRFAIATVLVAWLAGGQASARAATCEDQIGSGTNTYKCTGTLRLPNGTIAQNFSDCVTFTIPAARTLADFDAFSQATNATLGCTCAPTGKASSPKFSSSTQFNCVAPEGFEGGAIGVGLLQGKMANGGFKIKQFNAIQLIDPDGQYVQFAQCEFDPSCSASAANGAARETEHGTARRMSNAGQ